MDLTIEELNDLSDTRSSVLIHSQCSIVIVGPAIQDMEASASTDSCEIVARLHTLDDLESNLDRIQDANAVIVEVDSLDPKRLEGFTGCPPQFR